MNILIVDDNECNRYQLEVLLSGNGYRVVTAAHGAEALQTARQSPPDLIIADILMPVMDGFTLCREWKKDETLKAIPFVFYTATYTDERDRDFALSLGAQRFIIKPEEPDVFVQTVWEVIHQAERAAVQPPPSEPAVPELPAVEMPEGEETKYLRQYNEVLVHKLEDKLVQLEQTRRELEQDIAERKRAEKALLVKENAVASAISGIAMADLNGNITYVNRSFLRLWGYAGEEEVLGQPAVSLWESTEDAAKALQRVRETGACIGEMTARRRDGTGVEVEFVANLVREKQGQPVCLMVSFLDISGRKQAEAQRRQLELQVQQVQKLESLGLLAGGIAHDFNNLLTAVLAHASLASADLPPESSVRGHLIEIERVSQRAADLCRQLLAYSGRVHLAIEPLDLSILVEELVPILKMAISKKVVLECHFPKDLPAIEADPTQIRQVVMNLVINGSEAIGDKEGLITVSAGALDCDEACLKDFRGDATSPGTYVYLDVTDNGCGMDAETQAKIFDPFFTTKFTGRGLGLAAVLGIAQSHRSAVKVQSAPGQGTTFRMLFPVCTKPLPRLEPLPPAQEWRGSGTVLVIDDEKPVRDVAAAMLERLGFRVVTAVDGQAGLDLFREDPDQFTCVLLDLTMPRKNGEEVARELRRLRPALPILLTSGYSAHEITSRFADQPVAAFISKPYQLSALRRTLRQVLAARQPARPCPDSQPVQPR